MFSAFIATRALKQSTNFSLQTVNMGQKFGKGVESDGGVYDQCTPSTDWERDEGELFWTWRATPPRASVVRNNSPVNRASAEENLFWSLGSNKDQDESCEAEDMEVDLFWTWRTTLDEERPPVTDVTLVSVAAEDEFSGQGVIPEILENPETLTGDPEIFTSQDPLADMENPVLSDSQMQFGLDLNSDDVQNPVPNEADGGAEIQQSQSGDQSEEKLEDEEISGVIFEEINSSMYEVGELLAEDSLVSVYEGTRVQDDLKVLVKYINTMERVDYIFIPGYPAPLPRQVGLHLLACQGDAVHEILQLVDWQEFPDRLVMVLDRPSPCEGLDEFLASKGGELDELSAKEIMWQATWAAHMCCKRGVFHRDIKLKNFLIKADTLDLKLDNFGCGELLHKSAYKTFTGTRDYFCPEFFRTGEYYGKPATVYSLGVLLFAMLCGKFPDCNDRNSIWSKVGLTEECCSLLEDCLQEDPDRRIRLKNIFKHKWFQVKDPVDGLQTPVRSENEDLILYREWMSKVELEEINPVVDIQEINLNQYEIGPMLGEGGFGKVYEGTRVQDGLKVAVKIVWKNEYVINDYIDIPGYPVLLPREVGLQMLACEGTYVPSIIQFLDWEDRLDHYVMVLERPSPCEDVLSFMNHSGGRLDENMAQVILGQATKAAEICCMRGVFHRDIKVENLLINPNTMEVKLIDFGCGALFKNSAYKDFMGTDVYLGPEYFLMGEYYAKPATVYSLGVLLFVMLCGKFPRIDDLDQIDERRWCKDGLTIECCRLVEDCLQKNPDERIHLEMIRYHEWFQDKYPKDGLQSPVRSAGDNVIRYPDDARHDILIIHTSNGQSKEKLEGAENPGVSIQEINCCQYEIGPMLGEGGFGKVFEGTRVQDGLKVAVKIVRKTEDVIQDYINIPGYPEALPREVYLQMLACDGKYVPSIVQFLDWEDRLDHYVMVLERPSPCEDLSAFVNRNRGCVTENQAQLILWQAIEAAQICCMRGVLHRDIKMDNLLINPDTMEVKLIDFGCGDLFKNSAYTEYKGTRLYTCPEFLNTGKYNGKPATVYSLGVVLFTLVCGKYPDCNDQDRINKKIWHKDSLTEECSDFIQACMQKNPEERIQLEEIFEHKWF